MARTPRKMSAEHMMMDDWLLLVMTRESRSEVESIASNKMVYRRRTRRNQGSRSSSVFLALPEGKDK